MEPARKIINDPVYGFITIDHPLILQIIAHPVYQRLRNIHQMAFAHLVYPGAVHSRLHHSLGAYHLMGIALTELKGKGIDIHPEEELGAKIAILLHDVGHAPFSHALEEELIKGVHHEEISLLLMHQLNKEFNGKLQTAIDIFTNKHPKCFLHQLVSGQLDTDRMDYLNRDSFFTGVAEGVIGYDRIIKMMTVKKGNLVVEEKAIYSIEKFLVSRRLMYWQVYLHKTVLSAEMMTVKKGNLVVEEKAIYSIEKFLVSRRLMYWQVYLHKTVLSAEMMLVKIIHRTKELISKGTKVDAATPELNFFLKEFKEPKSIEKHLATFCRLDDHDIMASIKNWSLHPDKILSLLCRSLVERKLFKIRFQAGTFSEEVVAEKRKEIVAKLGIDEKEASYFIFTGEASNTTYDPADERICILFKDGKVKDISEVDNALIQHNLRGAVRKHYICFLN